MPSSADPIVMSAVASPSPAAGAEPFAWATWPRAVALVVATFAARMAYLAWLSPYELVGDEAYYWEWSRHLDLCYYEKGPGLAYLIAASCRAFGDAAWAVRLPAAASSAAAAWLAGRLARRVTAGDARAGFLAVAGFLLLPAFQANAQLCTQDGPLIAVWLAMTAAGWRLVDRWERDGRTAAGDWAAMAAAAGVGFLFKQSALLFGLGLAAHLVVRRRHLRPHRALAVNLATAAAVFAALAIPVVAWNARHGWPTLAHTAGHLGAGGDKAAARPGARPAAAAAAARPARGDEPAATDPGDPPAAAAGFRVLSPLILVGAQVGAFGPAWLLLVWAAGRRAFGDPAVAPGRRAAACWLVCCSVPAVGFFVALSLVTPMLASWPMPSFGPLVVLVAAFAAGESRRPGGPAAGVRRAWRAAVGYGLVGWLVLSFPTALAAVPGVGQVLRGPLRRIGGHRQAAAELAAVVAAARTPDGRPPLIVARYYMTAAEYAFYLPRHPTVYNAGRLLGKRPSSYGFWPETDLADPALAGRAAVLDGRGSKGWDQILRFDAVAPLAGGRAYLGQGYRGVADRSHGRRAGDAANGATRP